LPCRHFRTSSCLAMFRPVAVNWAEDIIEPEVEVTPHGTIRVPKARGIGYAVKQNLVERLTLRKQSWQTEAVVGP
jgi:hypothetical protein